MPSSRNISNAKNISQSLYAKETRKLKRQIVKFKMTQQEVQKIQAVGEEVEQRKLQWNQQLYQLERRKQAAHHTGRVVLNQRQNMRTHVQLPRSSNIMQQTISEEVQSSVGSRVDHNQVYSLGDPSGAPVQASTSRSISNSTILSPTSVASTIPQEQQMHITSDNSQHQHINNNNSIQSNSNHDNSNLHPSNPHETTDNTHNHTNS